MRNSLLGLVVCIAACAQPPDPIVSTGPSTDEPELSVRDSFIAINEQLTRTVPNPELVNVGTGPNSGNGDPLWVAWTKLLHDLQKLPDSKVNSMIVDGDSSLHIYGSGTINPSDTPKGDAQ